MVGGKAAVSRLLAQVPLFGAAWSNRGLCEFAGLLAVFLEERLPLDEALAAVAVAARDPAIGAAARRAAGEVAQGRPLARCLAESSLFPPTFLHLADWGQQHAALAETMAGARDLYRERFEVATQLTRWLVPSLVFVLALGSVLFVVGTFYDGLFRLIHDLTWSPAPRSRLGDPSRFIQFSGLISIAVAGLTLLALAHILGMASGAASASPRLLRFTGIVLIVLASLAACFMASAQLAVLAAVVTLIIWIRSAMQIRAGQKRNLLGSLALAVDRNMPLEGIARAFAEEQPGGFAARAHALARRLSGGLSLGEAIARSPCALPPEAALAAEIGEQTGDLAAALRATTYDDVFDRTLVRPVLLRFVYVVPAMIIFLAYMKVKIEPSMVKIFADFDTQLPAITRIGHPLDGRLAIH